MHPLHGWINLYKPEGITSAHILNRLKRLFPRKTKIGHAGTLDKFACGVLPVALNEATKTMPYMVEASKTYRFKIKWGIETDSHDRDGTITAEDTIRPTPSMIAKSLPQFIGSIEQTPPQYSALKLNGKRLSDYAREGQQITPKKRTILIHTLEYSHENELFVVNCSKGTYVRSLAVDIASTLGCLGHVSFLERASVGAFHKKSTFTLENIENFTYKEADYDKFILPLRTVLDDIPAVPVSKEEAQRLHQGLYINRPSIDSSKTETCYCHQDEMPVALCRVTESHIHPKKVFNIN